MTDCFVFFTFEINFLHIYSLIFCSIYKYNFTIHSNSSDILCHTNLRMKILLKKVIVNMIMANGREILCLNFIHLVF